MTAPQPHFRTLLRSDLVHVCDYRCTGTAETGMNSRTVSPIMLHPRTNGFIMVWRDTRV